MSKITPARRRVLLKAAICGKIMIAGGFGGEAEEDVEALAEFDRRPLIDRLIIDGLMTWGEGANQYQLTAAGRAAVARMRSPLPVAASEA